MSESGEAVKTISMANKWVINNNRLVLGQVEFHNELCKDNTKTIGGGLWFFDRQNNVLICYGISSDFGHVSQRQFDAADKTAYDDNEIFYCMHIELGQAIKAYEKQKLNVLK